MGIHLSSQEAAEKAEGSEAKMLYTWADCKRAFLIAAIVGSVLVLINQTGAIVQGSFDTLLYLRIGLNYATPFTVSSFTSLLHHRSAIAQRKTATTSASQKMGSQL